MRRALLAVLAVLCAAAAHAQQPITVGQTFLTVALDPARGSAGWALTSHGVSENLFAVGRDGRIAPRLAEAAERVDERTWRVTLRADRRFSDGSPMTAEAVAAALNRTVAENPAARASAGVLRFSSIDPRTLQLVAERPLPHAPAVLAEWVYAVYRSTPGGIVYTGPWRVAAFEQDRLLRLEPNPHYEGAASRPPVVIRRFSDAQAVALAAQSGEVDLAFNVPAEALPRLRASQGLTVRSFQVGYQYMMWLNTTRPALADVRVRRALDLAIDRRELAAAIGGGEPATGMFSTEYPFASREARPHDAARAASLLDEAGWRLEGGVRRRGGETLRLTLFAYPQRPDLVTFQPVIRTQLRRLGIEVETRVAENPQALATGGDFDLLLWAQHTAPAGDPGFFPSLFLRTGAANNFARFGTPAIDALIDRFAATVGPEQRADLAAEVERAVAAEAPVVYLMTPVWHVALSARLAGYEPWGADYFIVRPDLRARP